MQEVNRDDSVRRVLAASWWLLFPAFALLAGRLAYERGCRDPLELLPSLMNRPLVALAVAGVYLAAYLWCVTVWFHAARLTGRLIPGPRDLRAIWSGDAIKIAAFLAALAIEQLPRGVWTAVVPRLWHC